ncbi:M20 family peptidase [Roseivirga pacifica]|uniref:M20 family peptidase n=1 Tax=Roseivirga pacifica TaxID=1267423 RepID=UPI002095EEDA|nr:M20 family peptidase [Roseivirga pacifica]MCO6357200.1 M20/M25/M40 family metallo-hydrolase [Roseivirga pacifica]MCO6368086.1 M20/M25/M40 family metallo-hydrolase [Roseivirga pacifica]MCO6369432.1 M20/M25/M40 family metallo-hydrolase [Roseivirga pacifica]MCO6373286.1 M20/M25/M40 family metallo-hydrolase [Roseivirga pacifica]MCO6377457.1 M20/M25/M40 family metallo-hydrolase [Roseivirga pacifica]
MLRTKSAYLIGLCVLFALQSCSNKGTSTGDGAPLSDFTSKQMKGVEQVNIDVDLEGAVERLSKAVTFKTISNQDRDDFDTQAFLDYHEFLEKSYPNVHKVLKKEVLGDPRPYSLLYTWQGKDPSLEPALFYAHMDVVPVPEDSRDQWNEEPFAGTVKDGYIWGRGVLDDKNQIHGLLEAAEMKLEEGWQPSRTIYFVFGQDEEVGGPEGAKHIADVLEERGIERFAFVMDESAPITPGIFPGIEENTALIGIAQKGFVSLEIAIHGVGGHSSQPPAQSNIGILAEAITKLEKAQFPYRIHPAVRHQYRFMGPELDEEMQPLYAAVAFGKDDEVTPLEQQFIDEMAKNEVTRAMLHTTIAVTMINAGVKDNVLPPSATAVVNFRPMPGDTPEVIIEHVKNAINDDRISVRDISASTPATNIADPDSDAYKILEKSIRQIWGNDLMIAPFFVIGGSDAKHFQARDFAPDVYTITTIQLENTEEFKGFHGVNERILVDEYAKTIGFFYQMFGNLDSL